MVGFEGAFSAFIAFECPTFVFKIGIYRELIEGSESGKTKLDFGPSFSPPPRSSPLGRGRKNKEL